MAVESQLTRLVDSYDSEATRSSMDLSIPL